MSKSEVIVYGTARFTCIDELLDAFHHAAEISNLAGWAGCFHNEHSRFLGTDVCENWTAEEAVSAFRPHFNSNPCAWKYTPIPRSRVIQYLSPELPPAPCVATFDECLTSCSFLCKTRGTGTAIRTPQGYWFLAQYFLSFNMPNAIAKRLTHLIAVHENEKAADALLDEIGILDLDAVGRGVLNKAKSKGKVKK